MENGDKRRYGGGRSGDKGSMEWRWGYRASARDSREGPLSRAEEQHRGVTGVHTGQAGQRQTTEGPQCHAPLRVPGITEPAQVVSRGVTWWTHSGNTVVQDELEAEARTATVPLSPVMKEGDLWEVCNGGSHAWKGLGNSSCRRSKPCLEGKDSQTLYRIVPTGPGPTGHLPALFPGGTAIWRTIPYSVKLVPLIRCKGWRTHCLYLYRLSITT